MIAIDTSALLARHLDIPGREVTLAAMHDEPQWAVSSLARIEIPMAARRLDLGDDKRSRLVSRALDDFARCHVIPVDDRCQRDATEIGSRYPVTVANAIHLAGPLRLPAPVTWLSHDPDQLPAAIALGFRVISSDAR